MPIYEFRCRKCSKRFESLCTVGEKGNTVKCPECGATEVDKLISCFCSPGGSDGGSGGKGGCSGCTSSSCSGCH